MAVSPERKATVKIVGDTADAQAKIDDITAKADKLRTLNPEIAAKLDTAEVNAKLKVLRADIDAAAKTRTVTLDADADTTKARAELDSAAKTRTARIKAVVEGGKGIGSALGGILSPLKTPALLGGAIALGPTVAGVGAAAAGAGLALGAAGASAGAFGLLAKGAISQAAAAQKAYTTAQKNAAAADQAYAAQSSKSDAAKTKGLADLAAAQQKVALAQYAISQGAASPAQQVSQQNALVAAQKAVAAAQKEVSDADTAQQQALAKKTAADKAQQDALANYPPAMRQLNASVTSLQDAWKGLQKAEAPVVDKALTPWVNAAKEGIGLLKPIIDPAADAIGKLGEKAADALQQPFWKSFADTMGKLGAQSLLGIGDALGHVGDGLAHLAVNFAPDIQKIPGFLDKWASGFDDWAKSYDRSGFDDFMARTFSSDNTSRLKSDFQALEDVFGKVGAAMSKVQPAAFMGLSNVLSILAKMTPAEIEALGALYLLTRVGSSVGAGASGISSVLKLGSALFGAGGAAGAAGAGEAAAGAASGGALLNPVTIAAVVAVAAPFAAVWFTQHVLGNKNSNPWTTPDASGLTGQQKAANLATVAGESPATQKNVASLISQSQAASAAASPAAVTQAETGALGQLQDALRKTGISASNLTGDNYALDSVLRVNKGDVDKFTASILDHTDKTKAGEQTRAQLIKDFENAGLDAQQATGLVDTLGDQIAGLKDKTVTIKAEIQESINTSYGGASVTAAEAAKLAVTGAGVRSVRVASGLTLTEPVAGIGLRTGTHFLLGEAGPEAVVPLRGASSVASQVSLAGARQAAAGAQSGALQLQVVAGQASGLEAVFLQWLKQAVRAVGGSGPASVQTALGQ